MKKSKKESEKRPTIGPILDKFFSENSKEDLWIMRENDPYTQIVRTWKHVMNAVYEAKWHLASDCAFWKAHHLTSSSWEPGMSVPPVADPRAHRVSVASPSGTDPTTCMKHYSVYLATRIETNTLHTAAIGSFSIYATVDSVDCRAKKATMNIWMYNAMSRRSLGKYAHFPQISHYGMKTQYMWWNWSESCQWIEAQLPRLGSVQFPLPLAWTSDP